MIPGGGQFVFPPQGALTTTEPGLETILAICNGSAQAIAAAARDISTTSCDPNQRTVYYDAITTDSVATEMLLYDPAADDKTTGSGTTYSGLSTHNPDIAKAKILVPVLGE